MGREERVGKGKEKEKKKGKGKGERGRRENNGKES